MPDFVYDNVALPATKTDFKPIPAGLATQSWSASDIQAVFDALTSLRSTVPLFNVKNSKFGAVGDGSTPDAAAIQAAINLAASVGGVVFFPPGNYFLGTTGLTLPSFAKGGVRLQGAGNGQVVLVYTGTGTAFTIGQSTADMGNVELDGLGIDLGGAGAGANALKLIRVTKGSLRNLNITGRVTAPDNGIGIQLDGTGNYIGNIIFENVWVTGNYTKGIHSLGAAVGNTSNAHSFRGVTIARTTLKPGTGTIGFHWGVNSGDGRVLAIDVEGYDTGYQIDGGFLHGGVRAENNATHVAFGASSHDNVLTIAPFSTTTLVTYAGGQAWNSLIDTVGFQMNVAGGGGVLFQRNSDNNIVMSLRAGNTAEQNELLTFQNRLGVDKVRLWRNLFDTFLIDDGTNTKLAIDTGITGGMRVLTGLALTRVAPTYGATVAIDASLGNQFDVVATNGTAFTVSTPTNPNTGTGQRITVRIKNTSGGALGAVTWGAGYKMAAWTSPANANNRSIDFQYDGTNWVEVSRTPADVPN